MSRSYFLLVFALLLATVSIADGRLDYEKEHLVFKKFGKTIQDPYRWMEELDSARVYEFIAQENEATKKLIKGTLYTEIYEEIRDSLKSAPEVEPRPRKPFHWRKDFAPRNWRRGSPVSPSGNYTIEFSSDLSTDLKILRVRDNVSHQYLSDVILVKQTAVDWIDDESFLYTTTPDGRIGGGFRVTKIHVLGQSASRDQVLFQSDSQDESYWVYKSGPDELVKFDYRENTEIVSKYKISTGESEHLAQNDLSDGRYLLYLTDTTFYYLDYSDANNGMIKSLELSSGEWNTVMPEPSEPLDDVIINDDSIFYTTVVRASSRFYRYDRLTQETIEIRLPYEGTAYMYQGADYFYVTMGSNTRKYEDYLLNFSTWELELDRPGTDIGADLVEEVVSYPAFTANGRADATIRIVRERNTQLTPETPLFMQGYGGFEINWLPGFDIKTLPWLKRGGAIAIVTLPGGMEQGKSWHLSGNLFNKKNVFRSFAAAGSKLIRLGYTSSDRLVIGGGSNGGLLVGAMVNMYPRLFAAAVPAVGVMDMIRFDRFTGGSFWIREYGDPAVREDFHHLLSYSPYHNISSRRHPAVLVMTADQDDRVVPSHSYKYFARLSEMQRGSAPIAIHTKRGGSHSSRSGSIEAIADAEATKWVFLLKTLDQGFR